MNVDGQTMLNAVFDSFDANGVQMYICARLAPSEEEHMLAYHAFMQPKSNSVIVDMGCGIGGFGYYIQRIDPTLKIINVTNDSRLINRMQELGRPCVNASFEATGLPEGVADNVVFNESIGYGELALLMKESARLLKPGGKLIIKDFSPIHADTEEVDYEAWDYRSKRPDLVLAAAYKFGLNAEVMFHPKIYIDHWDQCTDGNQAMLETWGANKLLPLCQTMYKFVKGDLCGRP